MNYFRWRSAMTCVWLVSLILGRGPAAGAATTLPPSPDGGRFLFVVDKSSGMESLQEATEAVIFDLIGTGIYGQMQAGDTFGLWTFNQATTTGRFAMQVWDPRKARQQATVVAAFLSGVEYENSSNLKDVTASLKPVINAVSNVTIFVISDGGSSMKGTPFDKTINAEYKRQRKQRASAKRPFVTTLIARDGWIIDQSVTIAGTPIRLPPRRVPPPLPVVSSPIVQVAPPSETRPGIAIDKPIPKMTILTKPPALVSSLATTSAPVPAPAPALPRAPVTTVAEKPAPEDASNPANPLPSPDPLKPEIASQETILAAATKSSSPGAVTPEKTAPTDSAATSPSQLPETVTPPKTPSPAPPAQAASTPDDLGEEPSTIENALARLSPAPVAVAARETSRPSDSGSSTGTDNPGVVLQGAATSFVPGTSPAWMMAFGGLLLGAVSVLAIVVLRNRQPAPRSSLITQSMDRR